MEIKTSFKTYDDLFRAVAQAADTMHGLSHEEVARIIHRIYGEDTKQLLKYLQQYVEE